MATIAYIQLQSATIASSAGRSSYYLGLSVSRLRPSPAERDKRLKYAAPPGLSIGLAAQATNVMSKNIVPWHVLHRG